MSKKQQHKSFTTALLRWNDQQNLREMPWKGEKNPYRIWLSEIILQQTRVEQGWEYYNRFIKTFPTIQQLAKAPEEKVFKLWEGLGYYTRCKNLIATAKYISNELNGEFPSTYEDILALKGVGPYTAAAIASFAYNLPHAVVDGNVFRVISRYFGIDTPIDSTEGKKIFTEIAQNLLDSSKPGIYNQALMDFGATVCKPMLPLCSSCVLQTACVAFNTGLVSKLPVKEKVLIKKTRWFYYVQAAHNGQVLVRKRGPKDIWENLFEFILIETDKAMDIDAMVGSAELQSILGDTPFTLVSVSQPYKQQLTHQTIHGRFIKIELKKPLTSADYKAVSVKRLSALPFPKFILNYLTDKKLTLNL